MECNKDEALRAKEIAERKFMSKDATGAMKFALKAQNLYPELVGIQQMIYTLDVHIAARNRVAGEYDWYQVLGVDPQADDETVRARYRKLALSLHPDKNKSVGADEAFKLVSQAWSLLSDKGKRLAYDQMRNSMKITQKVATADGGAPPAPPRANGFHNSTKTSSSNAGTHKSNGRPGQHVHKQKANTFWTVCQRCKTQYEYLRVYLNHNLLCPNCHKAFFAMEIAPPPSNVQRSSRNQDHSHHDNDQAAYYTNAKGQGGGSSSAANAFHQAYTKVKRDREEGQAAAKREEALRRKTAPAAASKNKGRVTEMTFSKQAGVMAESSGVCYPNSTKESIDPDVSKIIIQKARMDILNKLRGKMASLEEPTRDDDQNDEKRGIENNAVEMMDLDTQIRLEKRHYDVPIDVPSPDFHDFSKDQAGSSFADKQVWAIYDDVDGMPRRFAFIRNVISCNPFKVEIRWLIPRTNRCGDLLSWAAYEFPVACGDFAVGRHEIFDSLHSFSHKVRWTNGLGGVVRILPRKGDVWALYKNWSSDWNELTANEDIQKYSLVEVLEDFDKELGVAVVPLIKVAGYKAMFHHDLDFREVRHIPIEEISRFSHHIPSFLHRGQEVPSVLKGCKELDPAATPKELLHVVKVATEDFTDIEVIVL